MNLHGKIGRKWEVGGGGGGQKVSPESKIYVQKKNKKSKDLSRFSRSDDIELRGGGTVKGETLFLCIPRQECGSWGPSGVMPCEVRRAALALGCSLFGCVMTVSEPPKVNDVHKREPQ